MGGKTSKRDILRLARQVGGADEMPAKAGDRAALPDEAGCDGGRAGRPGETIPDGGFDGVGFAECHSKEFASEA